MPIIKKLDLIHLILIWLMVLNRDLFLASSLLLLLPQLISNLITMVIYFDFFLNYSQLIQMILNATFVKLNYENLILSSIHLIFNYNHKN
jgi:hypothetical protein